MKIEIGQKDKLTYISNIVDALAHAFEKGVAISKLVDFVGLAF